MDSPNDTSSDYQEFLASKRIVAAPRGIELKRSYYEEACKNLAAAELEQPQQSLFRKEKAAP